MATFTSFDALARDIQRRLDASIKTSYGQVGEMLIKQIKDNLSKGLSPVRGGGVSPRNTGGQARFVKYSPGYERQIRSRYSRTFSKLIRPVNLKLSGEMINSLHYYYSNSKLTVEFTSKTAQYHDTVGAGKSKVFRRLLPTRPGEQFSDSITNEIVRILESNITP